MRASPKTEPPTKEVTDRFYVWLKNYLLNANRDPLCDSKTQPLSQQHPSQENANQIDCDMET